MEKRLAFIPKVHGWHFRNDISTQVAGPIRTYGLCGGMCLSALNYFRYGIKIPALNWDQIPARSKVNVDGIDYIHVPLNNPSEAHPVFDYILHSQIATFQTSNIAKQFVFFTHDNDEQHFAWSVNDEFPLIKRAIDNNNYVIIGLRNAVKGDIMGHQCLVYGYNDENKTLMMYDPNNPDEECCVFVNGRRLEFGKRDARGVYHRYNNGNQYRSYYYLLELDPNRTTAETTYDFFRNKRDNFAVRPTYADPVFVSPAGLVSALATERVIATPSRTRR